MIKAVPRPDYSPSATSGTKFRPARQLFNLSEANKAGLEVFRKFHPGDRHSSDKYDVCNNEYYRDGYVYKDVNPDTYLHTKNIVPSIDETKLFLTNKKSSSSFERHSENLDEYENDDDDENRPEDDVSDDEDDEENGDGKSGNSKKYIYVEEEVIDETGEKIIKKIKKVRNHSYVKELAEQLIGDEPTTTDTNNKPTGPVYTPGDLVQVISGELQNLVARIVVVNALGNTVNVVPYNSVLTNEFTIGEF